MKIETFTHDIEVPELSPDREAVDRGEYNKWKRSRVKKQATFKELDEDDPDQHLLHFQIADYFMAQGDDVSKFKIEDSYAITRLFIKEQLVPDENFTAKDKELFLGNSRSIMKFAFWVMKNKVSPFFLNLIPDLLS
jgi:hypothetical protein